MKPMTPTRLATFLASAMLILTGCGGSDADTNTDYPAGTPPIAEGQTPDTPPNPDDADPDATPDPQPDAPETRSAEGLVYTVPAGWTVGAPRQMRVLTLDVGDGVEVAVAKWPGDVGGFESNLMRWLGQAGYNPADEAAMRRVRDGFETIDVGGAESTWMPLLDGTGGSPMIALWVPRGAQTWTFKITGDAAALRDHQDALRAWAETLAFE